MDSVIISVRENPEYLERAVDYFSSKWGVRNIYDNCISNSITTQSPLPRWYLMFKGDKIIGCYGLIVNDFISRQDIWPWICALYIDENERGKSLGSKLLHHGRIEAAKLGFNAVYLCTGHEGYYEKYGWKYIGTGYNLGEEEPARIYQAKAL